MSVVVTTNLAAMNAQRQFKVNNRSVSKSQEKLSSGYAINRAADDAAGLAISEKMRSMIRGLDRGSENIQDGISLVQVADGALNEVTSMLQRMNELSVQAANGTLSDNDRSDIQDEIKEINDEIDRIGNTTAFNDHLIFQNGEILGEHAVLKIGKETTEKTVKLVKCNSADYGHMAEAYKTSGGYAPAAVVDFSNVAANNIDKLYGKSFSFTCTMGCAETFQFTFVNGGGSSASNLSGRVTHNYKIDISSCSTGSDILNTLYEYVRNNMPRPDGGTVATPSKGSDLNVSHSNAMHVSGGVLTIYSNWQNLSSAEAAAAYYATGSGSSGKVNVSELTGIGLVETTTREKQYLDTEQWWDPKGYNFRIQCSSSVPDEEHIVVYTMNSRILGTDEIDVSTENSATDAIDIVSTALERVTSQRSELGAYQNRLEHAMAVNQNTSENTQAAESVIRDTDMAEEMVRYSAMSILLQAGTSMMAQANTSNQLALGLLG